MSGSSAHGGAREGAGRKPKFRSDDETVSITVPKSHKTDMQIAVELIDDLLARGFTIEQIRGLLLQMKKP
jgi:adenine/guanine phosphoribosyltransferase-like PRPP-binding protein